MSISIKKINLKLAERLEPYYFRMVRGFERSNAVRKLEKFEPFTIGITGSCGKSTTTKLLSELLAEAYKEDVHSGLGNNTKRWVYRGLRKLERPKQTWVQEISGGEPGYLDYVINDIPLDIAILTTIGGDHISAFGTEQAILDEKSKLITALKPDGVACLNIDDAHLAGLSALRKDQKNIVTYGLHKDADIRAEIISANWQSRLQFKLFAGQEQFDVSTKFVGSLLLTSILAALAAIHAKGLPLGPAIEKLAELEPMMNHMSVHQTVSGQTYLMDAFKAPYWATKLFATDVAQIKKGKTVLVLGQISDTGNTGSRAYRQIIRAVAPHCDLIVGMDGAFRAAARFEHEFDHCQVIASNDIVEVHQLLGQHKDALIIVKSGRRSKLWRLWEMAQAPIDCHIMPCDLETGCPFCPKLRDKSLM
ncbi:UDP-N-acetylmuramyl pentapeptide synthase [Maritalea mobilis]|uniref:UDP-N-acetylmuramyl pentapeptide synthase n=1 Tax=Maritalea mobilis TaxID=483324 RepID=A0A4R6VPF4_9HYPH|nr:Mur ligase family protein [Maritalea mobilis]TDQ64103.1 UDP-N-acetylmuramyl pentapeptide synthase [Maritalea mobilis]